jgi:drug/metabolite transporter (DMT)-like permease
VVYPLARGTGPLFSFCGAILVLHERPSVVAIGGALLVVCGILLISGGARIFSGGVGRAGLFWGAMTGLTIAGYTIVDGYSVKVLLLSPVLVDFAENVFRAIVFSYRGWRARNAFGGVCALLERGAWNYGAHAPGIHPGVVCHADCTSQPYCAGARDVDDDRRVLWDEAAA